MNEQRFTLDVSKEPAVLPVLYLGQGDKNGTTLVAELYDNGVALSASGYVPSFEMRLPGGKAYYKVDGTLSGNVATIPIDETYAAAVAGRACTAYVSLKSGSNVVSTTRMNVAVLESATNDVNPGQAYENGIEQAIADAESRIASAASSAASQVAQAQEQATTAIAQAQADQQQAADDLNAAIDALGDISEVAVPLMSETMRGGAKLGSGLAVDDGKLSLGDIVTDSADGPIYSAHGEGWAQQDGTPTPENPVEIRVARGRNLLDAPTSGSRTNSGVSWTYNSNGTVSASGTASANSWSYAEETAPTVELEAGTYVASVSAPFGLVIYNVTKSVYIYNGVDSSKVINIDTNSQLRIFVRVASGATVNATTGIQLELGSTPTPYVPYGHVGLEVRDSSDALVSCTPIPLPSKGWAGGLPDGTADALSVDSAGRYEWENACEMHEITAVATKATGSRDYARVTLSPTETRWASAGEFSAEYPTAPYLLCESWPHTANQYIAPTWNQTIAYSATSLALTQEDYNGLIGAKLLGVIPKANRITEHGYINLPEVPEGSTITIPELEDVGIRCFVNGARELAEHANNWGRRCKENESRIAALEAAIAEIATA